MTEALKIPKLPGKKRREAKQAVQDALSDQRHFPCPSCGADLRFHPGEAQMVCTHCEARVPVPDVDDAAAHIEHDFHKFLKDDLKRPEIEVSALNCSTCGASVEFDPDEHSRTCPFCDSVIVADVSTQRKLVPQGLLPFGLMEKEAQAALRDWLSSRWLAPNDIEEESKADKFNGIYVPIWTYDSTTTTSYKGQRGRSVGSGKNRRTVWTNVSGTVTGSFDDVMVSGSASVSAEFKDALGPWPTHKLETYQTEFLAGFRAENHTVGLAEGFAQADRFMKVKITDWIRADIGGSRQRILSSSTSHANQTFKHILLPVWITHYSLDKKRYRLSVNGATGKVYGQRPFSMLKLFGASAGASGVMAVLGVMLSRAMGA